MDLDSEVARAAAAGKIVLLRINTHFAKPEWVTNAVAQAGGTFFTFDKDGVPTTIPVFWDPTFLAKKKAMIAALGAFHQQLRDQDRLDEFCQRQQRRLERAAYPGRHRGLAGGRLHHGEAARRGSADH